MEKPIDVYIHVKFLLPYYKYPRHAFEKFLQQIIPFKNGCPTLEELEEMFDKYPPNATQLVQALDQLGIAPNRIASMMGITKQSVSYHRHRPFKNYRNPVFEDYFKVQVKPDYNTYVYQPRKRRKDSSISIAQRDRQYEQNQHHNPDQHPGVIVTSSTIVNKTQE